MWWSCGCERVSRFIGTPDPLLQNLYIIIVPRFWGSWQGSLQLAEHDSPPIPFEIPKQSKSKCDKLQLFHTRYHYKDVVSTWGFFSSNSIDHKAPTKITRDAVFWLLWYMQVMTGVSLNVLSLFWIIKLQWCIALRSTLCSLKLHQLLYFFCSDYNHFLTPCFVPINITQTLLTCVFLLISWGWGPFLWKHYWWWWLLHDCQRWRDQRKVEITMRTAAVSKTDKYWHGKW